MPLGYLFLVLLCGLQLGLQCQLVLVGSLQLGLQLGLLALCLCNMLCRLPQLLHVHLLLLLHGCLQAPDLHD